jgi:hypothetical protein
MSINDVKALGLDSSNVIEEKVPIVIDQKLKNRITRVNFEIQSVKLDNTKKD